MTIKDFNPPEWVPLTVESYRKLVQRKAVALHRRDKKRGGTYTVKEALQAMHQAFTASDGVDPYDGLPMDADLLGTYDNADSKAEGAVYKRKFARMPTVDHVEAMPEPVFEIVSWQTNDAKGDMTPDEFRGYCQRVSDYTKRSS